MCIRDRFRQYPLGSRASHAIGYINRINKTDLEIIEKNEQAANYRGTDHIGKTGLEQKYEFQLHGETGYEEVEIDAGGHAIRSLSRTPPAVSYTHLDVYKRQQLNSEAADIGAKSSAKSGAKKKRLQKE